MSDFNDAISLWTSRLGDCLSGRISAAFWTVSAKLNRAKKPLGVLPHALAFGQLRDVRLKALLGILACRYLKPLTVIVSDPHTVLVDPTVLDFANAFCCHQRRGRWGRRPAMVGSRDRHSECYQ
jgi:hypothetical protein